MFKSYMKLTLAFAAFALLFTNAASAQCADGEVSVEYTMGGGSYAYEISAMLLDADGNMLDSLAGETSGAWCLTPGDYTFLAADSYGDGWNGNTAIFSVAGNEIGSYTLCPDFSFGDPECLSGSYTLTITSDVPGCTSETASNYNAAATVDDGSCCFSDFVTINLFDSWGDGWSAGNGLTIFGTFYEFASGSSLSMDFCLDPGCYNGVMSFDIYPGEASWNVVRDGEVIAQGGGTSTDLFFSTDPTCVVVGCNDPMSCNYDPAVNLNDGSCDYDSCAGCTDEGACNYIAVATLDNGSCDYSCVGCTDATAVNYSADFTIACADCCEYCEAAFAGVINVGGGSYLNEVSWELTLGGSIVASGVGGDTPVCLEAGCYVMNMYDSWGDGWNGNTYSFNPYSGETAATGGLPTGSTGADNISLGTECTYGCTDAIACNYDMADYDDGSCDYSCIGCMDATAANYDPNATSEGECVYCDPGTFVLSIDMSDSFGDGWGGAEYYIYSQTDGALEAQGSIETANSGDGLSAGLDMICLAPGCYNVQVTGGTAAGEVGVTLSDQFGTQYGSIAGNTTWPLDFLLTGSCAFEGCTSATALNYNISANVDDGSCMEPPANNLFDNAEAVYCDAFVSGNLEYATDDMSLIGTQFGNNDIDTEGVWYVYNADANQQVTVSTCSTPANEGDTDYIQDTKIHVYTMGVDGLEGIADNDDGGCAPSYLSTAAFNVMTGNDYYVYVSRYSQFTPGNDFVLSVSCAACDVPSNDICETAIAQVDGVTFTGSTCCASAEAMDIGWAGLGSSYGVWFTFNSSNYDTFTFNAENISGGEIGFVMFEGADCSTLTTVAGCQVTGTCAGSVEDFTTLVENTDYYFLLYNTDAATCGEFEFTTTGVILGCTDAQATNYNPTASQDNGSCEYEGVVPGNDLCENAITLDCNLVTTGSTGGSTNTGSPINVAGCQTAPGAGVWYTFEGTGQLHNLSTCGSAIDSKVNIFSATEACGGGGIDTPPADACDSLVTVNYSIGGGSYDSEISWALMSNADSSIVASGVAGISSVCLAEGDYTFQMTDSWGDGWNGGAGAFANALGESMGYFGLTAGGYGEEILTVSAYSTEPSYQAGDFTCVDAASTSDGNGECSLFDSDDVNFEFVSEVGVLYYVLVGTEGTDGSFDIDFSCADVVLGCMNSAACNYNADANVDNSSCEFFSCVCADETGTAVMINMNDSFGDGWNGNTYVITDLAGNEVTSGTLDDAQFFVDANNFAGPEYGFDTACLAPGCYTITVGGGSYQSEVSWDISLEDGTVLASGGAPSSVTISVGAAVCGCTEAGACNYDPLATDNDGSCEYESCAGCTDMAACNYDGEAIVDDGTCCYSNCVTMQMVDSWGGGWNGGYYVLSDVDGTVIGEGTIASGTNAEDSYCLADGCYVLDVVGASFANEMSWTLIGSFGGLVTGFADESVTFNVGAGDQCVIGCTISCACNYNADANITDNDLCVFEGCDGCTYPDASNYDATAIADNGTCEFEIANPCPADLNGDGSITTGDLLIFLGAFGTICE